MLLEELKIIVEEDGPPITHGAMTFVAFLVAGGMPLIPYVFGVPTDAQFLVSIIATGISLFIVGALRSLVTKRSWLRSGLEMLGVGALAAVAAYGVGYAVKTFFGITI